MIVFLLLFALVIIVGTVALIRIAMKYPKGQILQDPQGTEESQPYPYTNPVALIRPLKSEQTQFRFYGDQDDDQSSIQIDISAKEDRELLELLNILQARKPDVSLKEMKELEEQFRAEKELHKADNQGKSQP